MRLYTRGGDRGTTALIGGERRPKGDRRIEAYGAVDEACAALGLATSLMQADDLRDLRDLSLWLQQRLWDVGADLAAPPSATDYQPKVHASWVDEIEPLIDKYQEEGPPLTQFVLRQGSPAGAALHLACTVVRRAEREAWRLAAEEPVPEPALRFLNRLSDLLFVMARAANARANAAEIAYENSPVVFRDPDRK
ncbi:cob(I)yrinic acid a,c-diamide adenosyltransferase [Alicyclobacillus vulcanalis]|uniref:Corrinoid adenosyltransferase n=1 Tax=Alicyclobacillus vulcanalis TaxID=252246 RepID=A0A1N7KX05_9BACL|nr:cob(I)yrinic acid a,c-diamide adenosyltransferase [Alicyclobacillus vulcanalis]SIS66016.1 ATP:cob(I)alamin adenosyltransferase [Alicyclobacillus vulcanalis]